MLAVNNSFGSTEAGCTFTIPFYLSGYSESVEFAVAGVKGLPGLEGRVTRLAPFRSSKLLEGQWTLTIPVSASPGEHELTLVALDPKGRISKAAYFLTIRAHTPLSPRTPPMTDVPGGAGGKPETVKGTSH